LKVLATRRYPGPAFDELGDVELRPLSELDSARPDVEALVVANEQVPLDLLPGLRLVANFGVGYDRLGAAELRSRGVVVTNTPGVLDAATADLTFALILAARRRVVEGDQRVRAGEWSGSWADGLLAEELTGATLGIVGLGRIGQAVARRARGFELRVVYTQRTRTRTELGEYRELDELLAEADIVSIHAPLTPETDGLVDARRLSLLKDGAVLVNTARGEIVDEPALIAALKSGQLAGAYLDVFEVEPLPQDSALWNLPNVLVTPHNSAAAAGNDQRVLELFLDNLGRWHRSEELINEIQKQ
jgi:glyoxylate reductase